MKTEVKKAIYCSICGSKLVEKSKFKVGDYVTISLLGGKQTAIVEEILEKSETAWGHWYKSETGGMEFTYWYLDSKKSRLATEEEIIEYDIAMKFHKKGRKPFEVKEGDLIEGKFHKFIIYGEWNAKENYAKEDFIKGNYKLLKTAEEVDEWLNK